MQSAPPHSYADAPLVCITGATSGIGQALAWQFYQNGYRLALLGRALEKIETWAHAHALDRTRMACYAVDVTDAQACVDVFGAVMHEHGVPNVVIASAGVSIGVDTSDFEDLAVFNEVIQINLLGTAHTFHPFIKPMCERSSGQLVSIASMSAVRGLAGHGAYCASKSGVVAYSEALRLELHGSGVGVTCILPGFVKTPLTASNSYNMPFLMEPEEFAHKAYRAVQKSKSYAIIPWQMGWVAKLLRVVPNALYDAVFSKRGRKKRKHEG